MKKYPRILTILLPALLAACGHQGSAPAPIGLVNTQRLLQFWPAYLNDNNQFSIDISAVDRSHASDAQKTAQRLKLQAKYATVQKDLTDQVRSAAQQVARDKDLKLIITHEAVGYGGTDITADVERVLKITEASPSASP